MVMVMVEYHKDKAKQLSSGGRKYWTPESECSETVEAITELLIRDAPFGKSHEIEVIKNGERVVLQANRTVLRKKIEALGSIQGKKLVIIGLGEHKGERGKYYDYYIAFEDQARKEGVIS